MTASTTSPAPPSPPGDNTENPTQKSPARLELLALTFIGIAGVSAYALEFLATASSARALGASLAPVIWALAIIGIARLLRRGRTRRARAIIACWASGIIALSELGALGRSSTSATLATGPLQEDLVVTPATISHNRLHFTLPHPGPSFVQDSATQASIRSQLGSHTNAAFWGFRDSVSTALLLVSAIQGIRTQSDFRDVAQGMRESAGKQGVAILEDSLTWRPTLREYRLVARSEQGIYMAARCIGPTADAHNAAVCAMSVTSDSNHLSDVREALHWSSE